MKKILSFVFGILVFSFLTGCVDVEISQGSDDNLNNSSEKTQSTGSSSDVEYTFGSTFEFDELEITIGDDYSFDTIENRYSDYDGNSVIVVPVTMKNLSDETHGFNMFYYDLFGSKGTSLSGVASYFDESIDYSGDLRSGASQSSNFYILYDGDGDYYIEFDNYSEKLEVKLFIKK